MGTAVSSYLAHSTVVPSDYTSYFVTVGLSNTVQLRLLGNYSVMLELLESLLCCPARHFLLSSSSFFFSSCVFSGCNKDVLFNLRVSSLTEPGLNKYASEFCRLSLVLS